MACGRRPSSGPGRRHRTNDVRCVTSDVRRVTSDIAVTVQTPPSLCLRGTVLCGQAGVIPQHCSTHSGPFPRQDPRTGMGVPPKNARATNREWPPLNQVALDDVSVRLQKAHAACGSRDTPATCTKTRNDEGHTRCHDHQYLNTVNSLCHDPVTAPPWTIKGGGGRPGTGRGRERVTTRTEPHSLTHSHEHSVYPTSGLGGPSSSPTLLVAPLYELRGAR